MNNIFQLDVVAVPVATERETKSKSAQKRKQDVLAILSRGNFAVFTRQHGIFPDITVVKKVRAWEEDEMGDLKAFDSDGSTSYVYWESEKYTVTEEVSDKSGN